VSLSPQQVADATFAVERQGFKKDDVRAFLAVVASEYEKAVIDAAAPPPAPIGLDESTRARIQEALQAAKLSRHAARRAVAEAEEKVKALEGGNEKTLARARDLQLALDRVRIECAGYKAALASESAKSSDSYAQLGDQVAEVLRAATTTADSVRAEAELHVAQIRAEAETYSNALRERAEQMLADARQEAAELRAGAESYLRDVQRGAEATARQVKTEADAEARRTVKAAEAEVARLVGEAEKKLDGLRAAEVQVRRGLEAIGDWVNLSLAAPSDQYSTKPNSMVATTR
jgi:cell division septum initiation protein DivIVA